MATTTITTTGPQDARLVVAFGDFLHPGRDATQAEIKAWLVEQMRVIVRGYEDRVARAAVAAPASFDPT
jgi:hypothetical protein